jgi:TRAP-type C4-dicarboxylate transport system permease large subunit
MRTINYLLLAVAIFIFVGLVIMKRRKPIQKKWQRRTVCIVGWLVALLLILAVVFFSFLSARSGDGPLPLSGADHPGCPA